MRTMTRKSRKFHPARRTRWASIGLSVTAFIGMVTTFNANAQAGLAKSGNGQPQSSDAKGRATNSKVVAPRVKVIYVPATPAPPKVVVVHVIKHVKSGSGKTTRTVTSTTTTTTQGSGSSNTHTQPQPAPTHVVTNPVPIVQPTQPSQTTSGGSGTW